MGAWQLHSIQCEGILIVLNCMEHAVPKEMHHGQVAAALEQQDIHEVEQHSKADLKLRQEHVLLLTVLQV